MEEILKYLTVIGLSGVKFIFGPTLGNSFGYPVLLTAALTILGTMIPVYILTYFGHRLKSFVNRFRKKNRKVFTRRNRRFVKIWRKYGVEGIAIFTPIFFSPIGGALIANALGGVPSKIIKWMWISAFFWALLISWALKYAFWLVQDLGIV